MTTTYAIDEQQSGLDGQKTLYRGIWEGTSPAQAVATMLKTRKGMSAITQVGDHRCESGECSNRVIYEVTCTETQDTQRVLLTPPTSRSRQD